MVTIERSCWVPCTVEKVYEVLTDEAKFVRVVKRIASLQVLERTDEQGQVAARVDLPGGKIIDTVGVVEGHAPSSLSFKAEKPFPLHITWQLSPATEKGISGTQVLYSVGVDLSPVISFMPTMALKGYVSAEMDGDLTRLAELLATEAKTA